MKRVILYLILASFLTGIWAITEIKANVNNPVERDRINRSTPVQRLTGTIPENAFKNSAVEIKDLDRIIVRKSSAKRYTPRPAPRRRRR